MTRFDRLHNLFKWNNSIQAKQLETIDDFPQSCLNGSAARVGSTSLCRTSSTPVVTVEATIKLHHRNHSSAITFNLPALLPRLSSRIREHPWRHLPGYVNVKRFNFNPFFSQTWKSFPRAEYSDWRMTMNYRVFWKCWRSIYRTHWR